MSKTFASLFSGFGLADIGAKNAGCELVWGIELDSVIADVSRQLGHKVLNQSVIDADYSKLDRPDILWASPPCPNFSIAKTNAAETELDIELAKAIVNAITALEPQFFILENVEGYKRSKSLQLIEGALYALGYWCDRQVINAADFGVPQTRRRLILRAVRHGFVPSLPMTEQWNGWYGAIEDLIPDLPETQLAEWQRSRIPDLYTDATLISGMASNYGKSLTIVDRQTPSFTVTATTSKHPPRALLVPGANASSFSLRLADEPSRTVERSGNMPRALLLDVANTIRDCTIREPYEPSMTVTAEKMRRPASTPKILDHAKVLQLTSRCLARFQTMPDWYDLPANNKLACKGIGNGVPCLLAQKIISSLVA